MSTDQDNLTIFHKLIELFNALDVERALSQYYADDAYYRYGSFPPAIGKDAIRAATYSTHLDFVKGMSFKVLETWAQGNVVIAELELHHNLADGSTLVLPCTDVVRFAAGKVQDFRVYMDPSPLLAKAREQGVHL
jgi:ketosteroid isomerase-like protein